VRNLEPTCTEDALCARACQQAALGDVAVWALAGADVDALLHATTNVVATALDAEFVTLFALDSSGNELVLCSAAGLVKDLVGQVSVGTEPQSQHGFTLQQVEPVVVDDLSVERRFAPGRWLLARGALSGVSVVIPGGGRPYGVLAVHALRRQAFSQHSAAFIGNVANILGLAIAHRGSEEGLYRRDQELRALVEHMPDVIVRLNRELKFTFVNQSLECTTGRPSATFIGAGVEALGLTVQMADLLRLRLTQVFRNGRSQAFDLPWCGLAGQQDFDVLLIPELARDGSVESVVAIARDVTERRRAEAVREEQQRQILAREERLEALLAQVLAAQSSEQRRRAEAAKIEPLSPRERQVLRLLAQGWTNAEIANDLQVSVGTIKNRVGGILPKLGAVDRTQAAARAVELGLVDD
jgi:PAS domain S-box-containing protein